MILKILTHGKKLNKPYFITEIASTHDGSKSELNKLIKKIINNSSDFIKFQIFDNNDLCHISSPFFNGLKKIELPYDLWKKIIFQTLKKKKVILEPFDEKSFRFCKKFKSRVLLKISSSEHDNNEMILDALKNFKKVFFNISGFEMIELKKMFKKYKKYKKKIILMYGFQSFPSNPKDLRLEILRDIHKLGLQSGYADHSKTDDILMTYLLTSKAVDLGTSYIEKHVTYKRSKKKPDYISSFEPDELEKFIFYFKKKYISNFIKNISKKEKIYCKVMGKFGVASSVIRKHEKIKKDKIKFLRIGSSSGLSRRDLSLILRNNKIANKEIVKNEILQKKFFISK